MAARSAVSSTGCSDRITVSPLVWEDVTFFTSQVRRTTSLMWLSHMPQAIPSIFRIVSIMMIPPI